MFHVYTTVLAIGLGGAAMLIGLNSMNTGQFTKVATAQTATAGFYQLSQAIDSYKIANRGAVPATKIDASLPESELSAYLTNMPKAPPGMEWSYGRQSTGPYFCLKGTVSEPSHEALLNMEMKDHHGYVAKACTDEAANHEFTGSAAIVFKLNASN